MTSSPPRSALCLALVDVPVGRYVVTAALGGEQLRLRLANSGEPYEDSLTADFDVPYGSLAIHHLRLELRKP